MSVASMVRTRVFVTDAWDTVALELPPDTTVGELKRRALRQALRWEPSPDDYEVKHRGALILDEQRTLQSLGVKDGAPFIVLPTRRIPVR